MSTPLRGAGLYKVPSQRLFGTTDAAKYLGMSINTLRKYTDLGIIDARWDRWRKQRVYTLEELDRYIKEPPEKLPFESPMLCEAGAV